MPGPTSELPYLTPDIAGTGGVLRQSHDDFFVDETLPYEPGGEGDHVFARIEKRGLTTPQAAEAMARALAVSPRDVGWAGMKDRHAVTRQTLSFPPPCTPEAVLALSLPGITVLEARRHRHKLRTGHVRTNRFVLCVRAVEPDAETAAGRALAVLTRLASPPGSPNWFGAQRFGASGNNAEMGRALVLGLPTPGKRPRGKSLRLYISALQSELFNEYLRERLDTATFDKVIDGDILQKTDSGGMFTTDDVTRDQARLLGGEIVPTGPMPGHRMTMPAEHTSAGRRERDLLARHELTPEAFARVGKLGVGTRRPLAVRLQGIAVTPLAGRAIELCFELPAGSYATAVMREVVKGPAAFPE